MKSLQLIKASTVKPVVTAISVYYIIILALLIFATSINGIGSGGMGFSWMGGTSAFLGIFAMIHIVYMFNFSQNVCVSRKTCFISAIYTIVALSIIVVILDMFIVLVGSIMTGTPLTIFSERSFGRNNVFVTILLIISGNILGTSFGMLIGITWYRMSKFVRICVGTGFGVFIFIVSPQLAKLLRNVTPPEWFIDLTNHLFELFARNDMWTVLANIVVAATLSAIFYVVLRKAEIKGFR